MFLRNFLSFWAATVVIAAITVALVSRAYPSPGTQTRPFPLAQLRACAEDRIREMERSGPAPASKKMANNPCGIVYMVDRSNPARFAVPAPADVRALVKGVTDQVPVSLRFDLRQVMAAFAVSVNDADVVAVAILPGQEHVPPPVLRWHLLVAAVVSTFTCFALTRHFVNPIRKLQSTTDSFGRGNLDVRPDGSLLNRQDELGDLSRTIAEMSARISTLLAFHKNFLVQVSHELGSPLTRLTIALALARRKADPALLPELDRIQRESTELNSMIQQLLKLARLENELEKEDEETYSLNLLMEEVCADAQFVAEEMGKDVHCVSPQEIALRGHRGLLKSALDNVLRNAIRFTPEGSCVEVYVFRELTGDCVVRVIDDGAGVPDDKLKAIFEPFVQVSSSNARGGAGLGLAIAKQAVVANGGTIRALNLVQGGLLIEIKLPIVPSGEWVASTNGIAGVRHSADLV
jgi:two-component system, OmpR family, sensor histidine kinase CpxA